jgi:hypothetical protein
VREQRKQAKRERRDAELRAAAEQAQAALPVSPTTGQRLKRSEYIRAAGGSEDGAASDASVYPQHHLPQAPGVAAAAAAGGGGAARAEALAAMGPPPPDRSDGPLVDPLASR